MPVETKFRELCSDGLNVPDVHGFVETAEDDESGIVFREFELIGSIEVRIFQLRKP